MIHALLNYVLYKFWCILGIRCNSECLFAVMYLWQGNQLLLEENCRKIPLFFIIRRNWNWNSYFHPTSHLPPSQGGRYSGFGSCPNPPPKSASTEFFDTAMSSLSTVSEGLGTRQQCILRLLSLTNDSRVIDSYDITRLLFIVFM